MSSKFEKITFLINSLGGGGAEGVCVTLANGFVGDGIDVDLVVLSLDGAVIDKDLDKKINLINLNTKNARKSFGTIKNYIQENKTKKILVFNFQLAILLVWMKIFFNLKFQLIARNINTLSEMSKSQTNFWHKFVTHFLAKIFYRKVDLVICQSNGMSEDLIENYGFEKEKMITISNPINKKVEKYVKEHIELKFGTKKNYVLFVGRLEKQKGLHYLLEAFCRLEDKEVILKLLGKGSLENELKKLAKDLGIEDRVIFEGFQEDVISYIISAKVVALTSLYEGFPNVLVESIALGTPVVSFDCQSGPSEIIIDGVNGYLVKYLDKDDFAKKLDLALTKDFDNNEVMNSANRFNSSSIISKYKGVLF